jgi:hypothetical protein
MTIAAISRRRPVSRAAAGSPQRGVWKGAYDTTVTVLERFEGERPDSTQQAEIPPDWLSPARKSASAGWTAPGCGSTRWWLRGSRGFARRLPRAGRDASPRFRLTIPVIDAPNWSVCSPTLRRNQGFLSRTLGIGKTEVPDWLATRFMDGTVQIGKLTVGETDLNRVRARVRWSGARVELLGVEARVENGAAFGRVSADLAGSVPIYRMDFHLDSFDFEGGRSKPMESSGPPVRAVSCYRGFGPKARSAAMDSTSAKRPPVAICWRVRGCG